MNFISTTMLKISEYGILKIVTLCGLISFEFFFGDITHTALIGIIFLTLFDFITAMMAAAKTGDDIKSRKLGRTAVKIFVYCMLISAASITERIVGLDFFASEFMIAFIGVTELISILENTSKAGYAIPQYLLMKLHDFKHNFEK